MPSFGGVPICWSFSGCVDRSNHFRTNLLMEFDMQKIMFFLVLLALGVVFVMWKAEENTSNLRKSAIECISFVNNGVDLTGKGKNNCTSPELIPSR
jgi:hypothetical protein